MQKILNLDRRILVGVPIAVLLLLIAGFAIGRATASNATADAAAAIESATIPGEDVDASTITGDAAQVLPAEPDASTTIPVYGTEAERDTFVAGLAESGVVGGTREGLLATADHVCYNLERLQAQNRSPAFAVRVVWNESLAALDSHDLAAFAAVFNAAPQYLCPDSIEYGEEVAYWLGY